MIEEPQANTRTFKIEPDDHGGRTKTVTINRHNVLPAPLKGKGRGKKPPITSHILLGFDTEYQAVKTDEAKKAIEPGARNQLLSYQFAVKVIHKDHRDDDAPAVEGIIIPDNETRLSLNEYVSIALGNLIDKYPDIQLPPDIYLIGHYTRADMPAFSDFRGKATAFLSNVRNTFLSIDTHIPLEIRCGDGSSSEFKVRVRDTMLLAPAGAKSLADIGKIVGFEKLTLDPDPAKELHIKENMADFRRDDWSRFREYAIRDAEVCIRYAEKLIWQSVDLFDEFKMPATLTGFGTKLVQADWKARGKNGDELLGRETVQDRYFSRRHGHFKTKSKRPLLKAAHRHENFVVETYHGGRNEQFIFGPADDGLWRDHDLSSAYTTAMSLIGEADWASIRPIDSFESVNPLDLAFFSVDFEFPEHVRFPTLPVRSANGIIFPRKGNSNCAAPEIDLAIRLGAKIDYDWAVFVPSNRDEPIFRNFIQTCIQKRAQFKKGTLENLLWKEIGNSTYGKTAQGLRPKRVYDLRDDEMSKLPESKITQPYFASFITSHVRAVLGEILNGFSDKVDVFSVTTDGFLSNASDDEIARATSGPLFRSFTDARRALDPNESQPLEIKHAIRRPIGWRTRGSATLVPGDDPDKIVLQKGGLKTPELLDEAQQNSYMINLFLDRHPGSKNNYKSAVGLRQMIQIDTDFVFRAASKSLSMEFDWKRKPVNVRDVTFEFEGSQRTHVAFDTVPIDSYAEFNHVRDTWERYTNASVRNIKSVRDYQAFALYRDTNDDPDSERQKYRRQDEDYDLDRVRRDLCRAFKKQAAGFDIECGRRKIRHIAFSDALRACGVPCELTDVENGKKAEFKPHQTFDTPRCIEALQQLKERFYPNLDIQAFLPQEPMRKAENQLCRLAA